MHSALTPGTILDGTFELLRPLGEGGMGVVWLARERPLARDVAVKIMRPAAGDTRLRRFEREARALAALDHPSILPVLHTGTDEATGLSYLVTRAVLLTPAEIHRLCHDIFHCPHPRKMGGASSPSEPPEISVRRSPDSSRARDSGVASAPLSLADLLEGGKQLPEAAVLRIARDIASALSAAHKAGILHRDLKPSNILFEASGRAILSDFGLAKFLDAHTESPDGRAPSQPERGPGAAEAPGTISLDESGRPKFIGSPSYAAPEALREGAASASPALDWYSFGAVLHEALTGDPPRALRPLSSYASGYLSRFWAPLLRDLLESDPSRRLQDPAAIFRALDRIERHPARSGFRRRLVLWLAGIGLLAGIGGVLWRSTPAASSDVAPSSPPQPLVTRPSSLVTEAVSPPSPSPSPVTEAASPPSPPQPLVTRPSSPVTEAASPPPPSPSPSPPLVTRQSSPVTEAAEPPSPPQPLVTRPSSLVTAAASPPPGIRGVIQSVEWPNPVTDFSKPSSDSAAWLSVPASFQAGTERKLPLGSEPDRLRMLWCPPDPDIAPEGFWILAEPISAQLASDIHNHLAARRDTPVWRPETDKHSATFDRKTAVVFLTYLSIWAGFYGQHGPEEADAPVACFAFPSNKQLYYARRVCPSGTLAITEDYPWTAESHAASYSDAFAPVFMSLQPILVRASRRSAQPERK